MIARTWRGVTRASDAAAYVEYLGRTGFNEYVATPGNVSVFGLRRLHGDRAEFLIVSLWDAPDAVGRFAGRDPERAVFYPEDDGYLVERDEHVDHYEVVHQQWRSGARGGTRSAIRTLFGRAYRWWRRLWPTAVASTSEHVPRPVERGWTLIGIR